MKEDMDDNIIPSMIDTHIEAHFNNNFCNTIRMALEFKFPNIRNLEVTMDEKEIATVTFEQTMYTQKEVEDALEELKKMK